MAVYYKFKSAKDYDSIAIDGHFISVANLKEKIFESKHLGKGTDFDLEVTNAQQTDIVYGDEELIPKNTSVLIRRLAGRPRMPIVIRQDEPKLENKPVDPEPAMSNILGADSSIMKYPEDEWDEFGNDLYAIPEVHPVQSSNLNQDAAPPPNKADEDSKIKALVDSSALDWQRQPLDGFGAGRGFNRGMGGGRMMGGRGFGRLGMERKNPPQGYICHRCKVPGHFIQHCPTNGDPNYDIKRVKPPTGIPKSMLMATPDGSYALPSGAVAVLRPNEAAFDKEIEGLLSNRSAGEPLPEFSCPLCKEIMKDAVLTSKCCFKSFCDQCIRDYIISNSMCFCGATNILADDLVPNPFARDTINRNLESNNHSAENAGSIFQVQDMESARGPQPKVSSPNLSAASKGEQMPPPRNEVSLNIKENANEGNTVNPPQQNSDIGKNVKVADVSEATHDSISVKEMTSQGSAPLVEEEVQQKLAAEAGKKKKKKKPRAPVNGVEMQWKPQDFGGENYMIPPGPSGFNPYYNGMQPGMEGYMGPYGPYGGGMPYMGYGFGPMEMPFGGGLPQDPFGPPPGCMFPVVPPQRDLVDFGMGFNAPPPMSREEFEARQAELRRRRENERRGDREFPKDREFGREVNSGGDVSSMKSKSRPIPPSSPDQRLHNHHRHHRSDRSPPPRREVEPPRHRHRSERSPPPPPPPREVELSRPAKRKTSSSPPRDIEHPRPAKKKSSADHHRSESSAKPPTKREASPSSADRKKASVFSRISFPEEEVPKKKKLPTSTTTETVAAPASSAHHHHRSTSNGYHEDRKTSSASVKAASGAAGGKKSSSVVLDYESSDDDRHFKRKKPSRYDRSPPAPASASAEWEEEPRHTRGSRERDYERDRGGYSKHR